MNNHTVVYVKPLRDKTLIHELVPFKSTNSEGPFSENQLRKVIDEEVYKYDVIIAYEARVIDGINLDSDKVYGIIFNAVTDKSLLITKWSTRAFVTGLGAIVISIMRTHKTLGFLSEEREDIVKYARFRGVYTKDI